MTGVEGRIVVITGASAGVGRALVGRFAAEGARLALIAREAAALEETRAEAEFKGAAAIALPLDVADAEAVFAAAQEIETRLGPIDIWINNAMVTVFSPVAEISPNEFRRVTDVTYHGYVHGTMAALRHMRPRNRGTIVQVGSALAYRGIPLQAAYCGAKHAVRGFTDSLRTELLHDGSAVRLTMVQLPAVNTPQFDWARTHMEREPRPVPPVTSPAAVADRIYRAALSPRREVWIGAATLKVILGNAIAPWYLDRMLARSAFEAQGRKGRAGERSGATRADATQMRADSTKMRADATENRADATQARADATRADNLFETVPTLHKTEGAFSDEANASALSVSETTARTTVIALGAAVLLLPAVILAAL